VAVWLSGIGAVLTATGAEASDDAALGVLKSAWSAAPHCGQVWSDSGWRVIHFGQMFVCVVIGVPFSVEYDG
jgi:hypothetical protein